MKTEFSRLDSASSSFSPSFSKFHYSRTKDEEDYRPLHEEALCLCAFVVKLRLEMSLAPTTEAVLPSAISHTPLPELLAPAGDWDCAKAAVENGADAIYFGLDKFNARMRAQQFHRGGFAEADGISAPARRARATSRSTRSFLKTNWPTRKNICARSSPPAWTRRLCRTSASAGSSASCRRIFRFMPRRR